MAFHYTNEHSELSDDHSYSIKCMREMATALVLWHTGTEIDDKAMSQLHDNVASVAEEFNLSPERVLQILVMHEPSLAVAPEK